MLAPAPVFVELAAVRTPLEALSLFAGLPELSLLQSAAPGHPLNRYSYLAADPVTTITGNAGEWAAIRDRIRASLATPPPRIGKLPPFQGGWIGWFGYELGTAFDRIERHPNGPATVPDVALALHDWVIAWDHHENRAWLISSGVDGSGRTDALRARVRADEVMALWQRSREPASPPISSTEAPKSDFEAAGYCTTVARVVEYVLAGDIFQANIAQRFSAPFTGDVPALYRTLTAITPAPMAALLVRGDVAVVSASPERFLRLDLPSRRVETRPIKGTRPRDADPERDHLLRSELEASEKDRAENVMIVDLMRNDLSRVCRPGTVRTPSLCAVESHPTVHHLVSTVSGELQRESDALDLLAATFPGGSITGAPKLRAMEIIRELEPAGRGVYSGAIGWIGLDGAMDSSIAIRTVTITGGTAVFHAGGGITARSVPAEEYLESLDKARALIASLTTNE